LISRFRREADEKCVLLGYFTKSSGNLLPTFWDNLSVPSSMGIEDGTDKLPQNAGKKLPILAA